MKVKVSRKAHFNSAHRLYNSSWSDEKNNDIFGKCNNQNYHGHNYELIVSVTGLINPETGYVMDVSILKNIIKDHVESVLDHKNLNLDVPYFKDIIPSAENISIFIYDIIKNHIKNDLELEVVLYETPRNFVTYNGN
ncbi:MAG: 6-carboxytetrahydropterin synthase [Flavobacteriaceae bacterium]|jgi:6-pyruvoyltetrahydropterin/6-carboxytetrahydropterin synthase|nr:6-carboxytetrahydropterin synthase [Flavobacteriaceae bacterium]|tara:strand:- start:296 stop:706 length:411 start_codon:yes stop_codon:yes gene_type:complete